MRNPAREREASVGWFATLCGALLLVVLGFGIGLLAGAAFEDPGLVMAHLAGRTRDLPLQAAAPTPDGGPPAVSAPPPPLGSSPGSPPGVAAAAPAAAPAPPAVPPPARVAPATGLRASLPASGGFAIQVGAFTDGHAARHLAQQLRKLGVSAYVADEAGGGARYKVRVGPIATREEATRLARKLKAEHRLPTWVLARDGE